jgi:hypothetical protein
MDFDGFMCEYPPCPDPDDDPPGLEPSDCNCHNDCGYCQVCNAAGECAPDPTCGSNS